MTGKSSYVDLIDKNLFQHPEWGAYARGESEIPSRPRAAKHYAVYFLYLGDYARAKAASAKYSEHSEHLYSVHKDRYARLFHLFEAALYRSLAGQEDESQMLWQKLVVDCTSLPSDQFLIRRQAHLWIYQAYAHGRLEQYDAVSEPARKGFEGISQGRGLSKAPHRNSLEYGLAGVLQALAAHKVDPSQERQQEAQAALRAYKEENVRYGKLGYPVIFDLQLSYPEVFTPVLPGPDPEQD